MDSNEETLPRPLCFDTSAALAAHLARWRGLLYGKRLSPWGQLSHGGTWSLFLFTCWKLRLTKAKKPNSPRKISIYIVNLYEDKPHSRSSQSLNRIVVHLSGAASNVLPEEQIITYLVSNACSVPTGPLLIFSSRQKGRWSILSRAGFLQFFCLFSEIPSSVSRSFKHTQYAPVWSKSTL